MEKTERMIRSNVIRSREIIGLVEQACSKIQAASYAIPKDAELAFQRGEVERDLRSLVVFSVADISVIGKSLRLRADCKLRMDKDTSASVYEDLAQVLLTRGILPYYHSNCFLTYVNR